HVRQPRDWVMHHKGFNFHVAFRMMFEKEILQCRDELVNAMTPEEQARSKNPELQCFQPALSEILRGLTEKNWADIEKYRVKLNTGGLPEPLKRIILFETQRKVWRLCGVPLVTFEAIPGKLPSSFKVEVYDYTFPSIIDADSTTAFCPDPNKPHKVTKSGNVKKPWPKIIHKDGVPQPLDVPWMATQPLVGDKRLWCRIDLDRGKAHIFWGAILDEAIGTFFNMSQLPPHWNRLSDPGKWSHDQCGDFREAVECNLHQQFVEFCFVVLKS
ncbi:hypothetical protein OF83DRAFT_1089676, partial [Amylostereum chailletii]